MIVNPNVGDISLTSSPIIDFTIVVFPELSKPLLIKLNYIILELSLSENKLKFVI